MTTRPRHFSYRWNPELARFELWNGLYFTWFAINRLVPGPHTEADAPHVIARLHAKLGSDTDLYPVPYELSWAEPIGCGHLTNARPPLHESSS